MRGPLLVFVWRSVFEPFGPEALTDVDIYLPQRSWPGVDEFVRSIRRDDHDVPRRRVERRVQRRGAEPAPSLLCVALVWRVLTRL